MPRDCSLRYGDAAKAKLESIIAAVARRRQRRFTIAPFVLGPRALPTSLVLAGRSVSTSTGTLSPGCPGHPGLIEFDGRNGYRNAIFVKSRHAKRKSVSDFILRHSKLEAKEYPFAEG